MTGGARTEARDAGRLRALYWWSVGELGFDPRRLLRAVGGTRRYLTDRRRFQRSFAGRLETRPCLNDWHEQAGVAGGEYFEQDLYVARAIHGACPLRHVDVGSRIDGFVAHVASFREIEIFDVRPVRATPAGIQFRQVDLMQADSAPEACTDSLSCLHALEHFGLGRYGDPIDPEGHWAGLRALVRMLRPGGTLYLSLPVGAPRVLCNSHRIVDPRDLVTRAGALGLRLQRLAAVRPPETLRELDPVSHVGELARVRYALGIFTFVKAAAPAESA